MTKLLKNALGGNSKTMMVRISLNMLVVPYAMQCSVSCNLIQNCLKVQSVSRKLKKSDNVELLKGVLSFCGHGF